MRGGLDFLTKNSTIYRRKSVFKKRGVGVVDMLDNIAELWITEDYYIPDEGPDVIVPIGYGTYPNKLTKATLEVLLRAILFWRRFPNAFVAFANSQHCFDGSNVIEGGFKKEILYLYGLPPWCVLPDAPVRNTVEEAESIRDKLLFARVYPRRILLIAGQMHSRSVRYIWSKVFPDAEIFISCIPYRFEFEPNHPLLLQRTRLRWFFVNFVRHFLLRVFGLRITKCFRHIAGRTKKPKT